MELQSTENNVFDNNIEENNDKKTSHYFTQK